MTKYFIDFLLFRDHSTVASMQTPYGVVTQTLIPIDSDRMCGATPPNPLKDFVQHFWLSSILQLNANTAVAKTKYKKNVKKNLTPKTAPNYSLLWWFTLPHFVWFANRWIFWFIATVLFRCGLHWRGKWQVAHWRVNMSISIHSIDRPEIRVYVGRSGEMAQPLI